MVDEVEKTASDEKGSAEKGISASDMEKNGMKEIEDHFVAKYVSEKLNLKLRELKKEIYDGDETINTIQKYIHGSDKVFFNTPNNVGRKIAVADGTERAISASPLLYMSYRIDRMNVKRAFNKLYKNASQSLEYSRIYKRMKLLRLLLISMKIHRLSNWQNETAHNKDSTSYQELRLAWGRWKKKIESDTLIARIPGFVHAMRIRRRSEAIFKLVNKRSSFNLSLLQSAFRRLKHYSSLSTLQNKIRFEAFLENEIARVKGSARRTRSQSNDMMIDFRLNFNSKTSVLENLLRKREELAEIRRGAEIMRLKADEMATKIRDWQMREKSRDFLHYDTVEGLAKKGSNIYL